MPWSGWRRRCRCCGRWIRTCFCRVGPSFRGANRTKSHRVEVFLSKDFYMQSARSKSSRIPLTTQELEGLQASDFLRLKLTEDEKRRLRELNEAKEQERQERKVRIRSEQALLLAELQSVGLEIQSVSDLVNTSERYNQAIPTLLKHLVIPYSDITREMIARALAVNERSIQKAWPLFVREYRQAPIGRGLTGPGDTKEFRLGAKDGLACTLSVAVTDDTLPELIALCRDKTLGESRLLLLPALKRRRAKNLMVKQALAELAEDPQLAQEIASWPK
jgi:hypothetical protein